MPNTTLTIVPHALATTSVTDIKADGLCVPVRGRRADRRSFSWIAWPIDANGNAVNATMCAARFRVTLNADRPDGFDSWYTSVLQGKPYMMPVAPFFYRHWGPSSWSGDNSIMQTDTLLIDRWRQVLALKPALVQVRPGRAWPF